MCNVINRKMAFTVALSVLVAGCGIKWATNRVLSNPDAIAKVGAVYDVLTPKDTTERLVFIQGDSIVTELHDTVYVSNGNDNNGIKPSTAKDTIRIRTVRNIRTTDTIIRQMPPDNRHLARLNDSLALYRSLAANMQGNAAATTKQLKTAENRLIWMAGILLLAGVVIGILVRFKLKL